MEFFLAFVGFGSLILIVYLLLTEKTNPAVAFIIVSGCSAIGLALLDINLQLGIGGLLKDKFEIAYFAKIENPVFDFKALSFFIKQGISSVSSTAVLFIFAILFFGLLNEAGVFNKIINHLLKFSKKNVYGICFLTVLISVIAHLDGSGASSFLIVIPAMLPIYEKLGMRKTTLMTIMAISLGVMNLLPWGGPTLRAATIIGAEANDIWYNLIPIQAIGLLCAFGVAFILARREIALGAGKIEISISHHELEKGEYTRDKSFFLNLIVLLGILVLLIVNVLPSYFLFMLGFCLILFINYPKLEIAQKLIDKYSKSAIMMATTLFAAGILIGVFDKSGIMKVMASVILEILPHWALVLIPLIVGLSAVPMALIFCTDSYFFGIMPIVVGITQSLGIDPMSIAIIMVVARNCATFISPVVPATLLGCGLSGVSIKEHISKSFFWVWGVSLICLSCGASLGIIHFF
ncbi:CitMHS family citrate transporter [Helicobacter cinaedi PAGU611]|uniref:CitMHS family transporter n=1 Tax=Helicobacter cinaedi TaxID=213 RepID=UPI00025D361F|nr:SLC13 family permease [Helicobacter cinaedi]QOQ96828.1 citrate transporter [Helicobacter cinaedi]BAM13137.1 CitMHS family citrate transporter [Helicobacter cinaedi PAGU611]